MNRWLAWFHRWAGVVLCLLFVVWFASGAVLHFVGFPTLSNGDRRLGSEEIDLSRLHVTPTAALSFAADANELRLLSVAGRPVYVASASSRASAIVAADTGELLAPFSPAVARSVAERFSQAEAIRVDGPLDYDQWMVHQRFDPYRPFFRVRLNDETRTDLYVSTRTGEVLQRTRSAERAWNWCGAVMHWIYFTPLRKNWSAWNQVVWWLSLAALVASVAGTWLGIVRFAGNRAAGRPGLSPFRGWMHWHHIIGLFASVIVVGWILSGWLSMDHGRLFSHGDATAAQVTRMRGMSVAAIAQATTLDSIRAIAPASEISFNAVAGRAFLSAHDPAVANARVLWLDSTDGSVATSLPDSLLLAGMNQVWPGAAQLATPTDADDVLYRRAESTPDDAVAFNVIGSSSLRVYVDRSSGRLLAVMDPSRRAYAWIYYALHTFNFPGLNTHADLRTTVVLALLVVGLAFSVTGVVLGVLRLKREFS